MADSVMARHPVLGTRWVYEWGLMLKAILEVWRATGERRYFEYVKSQVDRFVDPSGQIDTYRPDEQNLDHINPGKVLFPLYRETGNPRYEQAARRLREQLRTHPRTGERGFWHKAIYPHQMWLDGLYMAGPFLAEFAATFDEPEGFDEVAHQIILIECHTRDERTGLLYHGWDESRQQAWANLETGTSPHFWGRAMGWYVMALADVLDHLPDDHPQRDSITAILDRTLGALVAVQDRTTGLWYQVLDQGDRTGNYLEASASCMIAYALAKAIRRGYTGACHTQAARRAYQGILAHLAGVDEAGFAHLHRICSVAGLGGTPYRDGSFDYYISEPIVSDDFKGVGPFVLASLESGRLDAAEGTASG
ncbi:MAG: glycoside hydrolase family 88 protein [Anaerolineae bacterium]|nr:glycoside hydrolase family 88 protein [Anaerolineae bacterium]